MCSTTLITAFVLRTDWAALVAACVAYCPSWLLWWTAEAEGLAWLRGEMRHFGDFGKQFNTETIAKYLPGHRQEFNNILAASTCHSDPEVVTRTLTKDIGKWLEKRQEEQRNEANLEGPNKSGSSTETPRTTAPVGSTDTYKFRQRDVVTDGSCRVQEKSLQVANVRLNERVRQDTR